MTSLYSLLKSNRLTETLISVDSTEENKRIVYKHFHLELNVIVIG